MVEVEALSKDAGLYALAVRENSLSDRTTIPGLRYNPIWSESIEVPTGSGIKVH